MLFAALIGGHLLGEADRAMRLVGAACIAGGVGALALGSAVAMFLAPASTSVASHRGESRSRWRLGTLEGDVLRVAALGSWRSSLASTRGSPRPAPGSAPSTFRSACRVLSSTPTVSVLTCRRGHRRRARALPDAHGVAGIHRCLGQRATGGPAAPASRHRHRLGGPVDEPLADALRAGRPHVLRRRREPGARRRDDAGAARRRRRARRARRLSAPARACACRAAFLQEQDLPDRRATREAIVRPRSGSRPGVALAFGAPCAPRSSPTRAATGSTRCCAWCRRRAHRSHELRLAGARRSGRRVGSSRTERRARPPCH